MALTKRPLGLQFAALACIVALLWSLQSVAAAPLPQAAADGTASNDSLTDPFSTPSYLAPSTFTWEQGVYGVLFIFFGGVEVLHGYKYIRITMLVMGFLVWASTAVMIMIIVETNSGSFESSGIYFMVWLLVGIVGSIISFYLWHVGIILTGAYGGFVVLAVIFTAADVTSYILRYTVLAIVLVVSGFLTHRYERFAVILATSVGGAYCMMFGLDMFVQTGFRSTFDVMLSQSNASFQSNAGTWVMIACVPIIAIIGIVWELKHHEEPVGSWWFGHGARPLPAIPGEKQRRCCCIPMSRSAKAAAAAGTSTATSPSTTAAAPANSGSDATLVPKSTKTSRSCCLGLCGKRASTDKGKGAQTSATTSASAAVPATGAEPPTNEKLVTAAAASEVDNHPLPVEKATDGGDGHETIGHTGVHKVVIQREEREFSMDVDERW
ncbi:hypothetical protein EMPS_00596 [Entomortierella parvispora]|uniref:Transmembrane protein 198 n=1 Tax=Entomortierella parvispora TaxID=205924 RepID=A0A9P3H189_9FUNG|nr:hypothetical protein EMPS_00596 [Entomortierella parvispora]